MKVSRQRSAPGAALLAAALLLGAAGGCRAAPAWKPLPSGLELRVLAGGPEGRPPATRLYRLPAGESARLRVRSAPAGLRAGELAREPGVLAAVNANFFDAEGRALGWVVADGAETSPLGRSGWGVLSVDGEGRVRIERPKSARTDGVRQAVQAGPLLVEGGRPNPGLKAQSARRVFVGLDAEGRVVLGSTGLGRADASALAELLARSEAEGGAGLVEVLNLDGGSSAQLFVRGGGDGGDLLEPAFASVPVMLTVERVAPEGD